MTGWLMNNEAWEAWMTDKPVLQRLYEERVFSLGFLVNGNLGVTENCDGYFEDELTLADLAQLIAELTSVQAEMVVRNERGRPMTEDTKQITAEKLRAEYLNAKTNYERWRAFNEALDWAVTASEIADILRGEKAVREQYPGAREGA